MSIRIGWSLTRPKERKPGRIAGGVYLFEFAKTTDGRGRHVVVGSVSYRQEDLERLRDKGQTMDVRVIGLLRFGKGVTPELVDASLGRIRVSGRILAPPFLEDALARHME